MATYPDDADGATLAELAAHGVDLTQPLLIEFPVAVPDESAAEETLRALTNAGYEAQIEYDEGEPDDEGELETDDEEFGPAWAVYATVEMVPDYQELRRIQAEFDRLAGPFGGRSDGWGVLLDE